MRTILMASVVALGLGGAGAPAAIAAPAGGVLAQLSGAMSPVQEVGYVRRHGRTCYRKCYREFVIGRRVCRTYC